MSDALSGERAGRATVSYWRNPIAVWAILLGVLAHLAGFFAFSIELPPDEQVAVNPPEIFYSGNGGALDELMQEQSDLLDFEPLFLPTSRNASVYLGWGDLVERTEPFSRLPPKMLISSEDFPTPPKVIDEPIYQPLEMLERDTAGSFGAFGQISSNQESIVARAGMVEVYRDGKSEPIVNKELKPGIIDEAVNNLSGLLEWRLAVREFGVVGQPLLVRGSGLEAVDAAAADYLLEIIPEWGLPAGYYRVVIGP